MNKQGFTLIELLIVIAIITIMTAILFPVFATAREKARQATCDSNLKQIGLASMQYLQDYDERFFARTEEGTYQGDISGSYENWLDLTTNNLLYPYIKNVNVAKCPDEDAKQGNVIGYGYNDYLCQDDAPTATLPSDGYWIRTLSQIQSPATMLMFADTTHQDFLYAPSQGVCTWSMGFTSPGGLNDTGGGTISTCVYSNGPAAEVPFGRHSNGINIAYCDGHVKWVTDILTNVYNRGNDKPLYDGTK